MSDERITTDAEHRIATCGRPRTAGDYRAFRAAHAPWREAVDEYETMFWTGVAERRPLYSQTDLWQKEAQIKILADRFHVLSKLVCG